MENNEANREKLSTAIVEGWDLSDLIYYASQTLENDMEGWEDSDFKAEWENVFDDSSPAPATTKE
jgi:hypothetical protein